VGAWSNDPDPGGFIMVSRKSGNSTVQVSAPSKGVDAGGVATPVSRKARVLDISASITRAFVHHVAAKKDKASGRWTSLSNKLAASVAAKNKSSVNKTAHATPPSRLAQRKMLREVVSILHTLAACEEENSVQMQNREKTKKQRKDRRQQNKKTKETVTQVLMPPIASCTGR